jgi:hypothetical protein
MTHGIQRPSTAAPEVCVPSDLNVGCATCGDVVTRMRVLRVDHARELAICADGEHSRRTVDIALVGVVEPGEALFVHAGTALAREAA